MSGNFALGKQHIRHKSASLDVQKQMGDSPNRDTLSLLSDATMVFA